MTDTPIKIRAHCMFVGLTGKEGEAMRWRTFYYHDNYLYVLSPRANKFNEARDRLHERYQYVSEIELCDTQKVENPRLDVLDLFRVNTGIRVYPRFFEDSNDKIEIPEFTGVDLQDVLSMPDDVLEDMRDTKPVEALAEELQESQIQTVDRADTSLAEKYPKYFKAIPEDWKVIDVYGVHHLFQIPDFSGTLQHASKKLLLPGVRTGGKTMYQEIKEARDTLDRWLELNKDQADA